MGFQYPQSFLNVIDEDYLIDLEPWWFLCEFEGYSQQWFDEIKKQYPERNLIPFAKRVTLTMLLVLTATLYQAILTFTMFMLLHHRGGRTMMQ
jgi:hypothetical protein